jgi:hypothetical protein
MAKKTAAILAAAAEREAKQDPGAHDYANGKVPDGFHIHGVSQYDPKTRKWIKTSKDRLALIDSLKDAIAGITTDMPRMPKIKSPAGTQSKDLLCIYPMGDPHIGMYAWAEEAGEDYDLEIAERDLNTAVDHLVDLAPPAEHAVILNLGDFFHSDGGSSQTTRGTPVDTDGRFSKVHRAGLRLMHRTVVRALEKHKRVTVRNVIGNHDGDTARSLGVSMAVFFEKNPRVHVDDRAVPHWYIHHGRCLIGATHGDTKRDAKNLHGIMSVDMADVWEANQFRQWYCGHVHHSSAQEHYGTIVETFRTLAPKDAWHAAQGYRSGRDMRLDVWHKEHGMINRHIVGIAQVKAGV